MKYIESQTTDLSTGKPAKAVRPFQISLSIRTKLFGLFLFLLIILGFSGYVLQSTLSGSLHIIETESATIQTLQATTKAEKIYTNLRWTYLNFLSSATKENYDNVGDRLRAFSASLVVLKTPELNSQITDVENLVDELRITADHVRKFTPDSEQAGIVETEAVKKLGRIDELLNNSVNTLEDMLTSSSSATRDETGALHNIPGIFMLGGLLTLLFTTAVTVLQLFMPLSTLTRAMTAASIDTTNARDYMLPVSRPDEIGLATEALNSLLLEVSEGIERISSTERKLRETGQYLQAIMDNVVDGVITMNEQGRIETFSPSAEKIFQRPAREVVGAHISTMLFDTKGIPFDLAAEISGDRNEVFSLSPSELLARTKSGVMVHVELAIGQTGFAGRTMYVATLRDISTRKQMENFLEQAQRMETVGQMTGGIAHDFNNMLTVISGNFELIDMRLKTEDPLLKSMVAMGLETVRKGKDMTQRLLAISSKQLLKPEVMALKDRLPPMIELIKRAVREDIDLRTVIPEAIWNIRVDPVQFESALLNLAINARDAMDMPGGRITIEASNFRLGEDAAAALSNVKPGEYVMVAINDNGRGIPSNIIHRVLEPFFTTKNSTKGTGLGLSMVYGFTRQSGGFITIDSGEGKGTSVKLFFPRSEEKLTAVPTAAQIAANAEDIPNGTESLLVVEDRPDVLRYLTQTLRELGYRVTQAGDAQQALKKMEKRKNLDMLLTDIVMPGEMNGEMLAQEALRRMPHLKVLYMSGYTRDALVEQGALKQGVTLLAKPFTRADLARQVRQVLDS